MRSPSLLCMVLALSELTLPVRVRAANYSRGRAEVLVCSHRTCTSTLGAYCAGWCLYIDSYRRENRTHRYFIQPHESLRRIVLLLLLLILLELHHTELSKR